jgi:DNA polymerase family A
MQLNLSEVVTVDFETFFDSEYSLRSKELNLSDYVRDERFLAHCVSIKQGEEPTQVFWYDEIVPALEAIDWANRDMLAHNVAFDGFILSQRYGIKPRRYLDTMSMGQALYGNAVRVSLEALCQYHGIAGKNPNILGKMKGHREIPPEIRDEAEKYCAGDTDKCWTIFKRMIEIYPEDEIAIIVWTIRQFCDPVLFVDVPRAKAELEREQVRKQELIAKTGLDEDQLQSAAKFAEQLRALCIEPPMKISARTKLPTFAFSQQDDEFMALVTHDDQRVRELMNARLAAKSTIGETRAQRFVDIGENTLPVGYRYAAAHTHRWGGTNKMNLQNLEKEELDAAGSPVPFTGELRKSILAPPGYVLVVADSKQIEARVLAWLAGQLDLLELFRTGGNPYCVLASEIYGRVVAKADINEYAVGKAGTLGLGFYMGAKRFQATLAAGILGPKMLVSLEFSQAVVNTYRRKNDMIRRLWNDMAVILYKMLCKKSSKDPYAGTDYKILEYDSETIWLPNGMGLHYPDLQATWNDNFSRFEDYSYRSNKTFEYIHPGLLTENIVQALARIIIAEQLLRIETKYRVVMTTHDELVALAPEAEAQACSNFIVAQMSIPPAWGEGLPLGAESGWARNYSK